MEWQTIINSALGLIIGVVGWFARELWDAIKELRKDIKSIETSLPEHYVRRDDFKEAMKEVKEDMKAGFDRIENMIGLVFKKLESKQDK